MEMIWSGSSVQAERPHIVVVFDLEIFSQKWLPKIEKQENFSP